MHIILGALSTVVTILILTNRLSEAAIDLGWLNPVSWQRRRRWQKKYHSDPAFSIESPLEVTAGLMYTMARCSGDVSREQKKCMLDIYQKEFKLSEQKATELLSSCSFLIKDEDAIINNLRDYVKASWSRFDSEKKESALELIEKVGDCEKNISGKQLRFLDQLKLLFATPAQAQGKW